MFNTPILIGQLGRGRGSTLSALAASIRAALTYYWEFEENSGSSQFVDGKGAQNLTVRDNAGTSTTATYSTGSGIVGRAFNPQNVAHVTAYIPNSAGFKFPNTDHTYGGWLKASPTSNPVGIAGFVMGNVGGTATDFQSTITVDSDDALKFVATTTGGFGGRVNASFAGSKTLSSSVWSLVTATLDRSGNQIVFRVRTVGDSVISSVSTSFPSAIYTGSTSANFCINDGLSSDTTFLSSTRQAVYVADQCFYMTKAITDDEFNWLYNGGAGRSYAEILSS